MLARSVVGPLQGALLGATVALTACGGNQPPEPVADQVSTDEDTPVEVDVLANDRDPDGDPLTLAAVTGPDAGGTATVTGEGVVRFEPAPDFHGQVELTYTVEDGRGGSAEGALTVAVLSVNDAPTVTAIDDQTIDEGTSTGPLSFTIGDDDTAPADLSVQATSADAALIPHDAAHLVLGEGDDPADRTLEVVPAAGASGTTTVTVTVDDGQLSAESQFEVTVQAVNAPPVVAPIDDQAIDEDTTLDGLAISVDDPDDDPASLVVTASSDNASLVPDDASGLVLEGSGTSRTLDAIPLPDANGTATITVTADDGDATSQATFELTVRPVNDPPLIANATELALTTLAPSVDDSFGIDTSVSAELVDIDSTTLSMHWRWEIEPNGESGFSTFDSGTGLTDLADLPVIAAEDTDAGDRFRLVLTPFDGIDEGPSVTLGPVAVGNQAPTIDNALTVQPATPGTTAALGLQVQPATSDPDGQSVTLVYRWQRSTDGSTWADLGDDDDGQGGTIAGEGIGDGATTVVDLAASFTAKHEHFRVVVQPYDGYTLGSPVESSSVQVQNTAPVADDDAVGTDEDTATTFDPRTGDVDDDGDPLSVTHVAGQAIAVDAPVDLTSGARVELLADGRLTFAPLDAFQGLAAGASDTDTFDYTVSDGDGGSDTGTVTVTIDGLNDPPDIESAAVTDATEDATYTYDVQTSDVDGDSVSLAVSTLPDWLTFTDDGDGTGTLTGTPDNGDVGQVEVTVEATDDSGADNDTATQQFTITVANTDDPPAFTSSPVTSGTEDATYTYEISASDDDTIHGDSLTITAPTHPSWLSLTDHGDGTATLSGVPTTGGSYDVTLVVSDADGETNDDDTQPFTVTVDALPDIDSVGCTWDLGGGDMHECADFTPVMGEVFCLSTAHDGADPSSDGPYDVTYDFDGRGASSAPCYRTFDRTVVIDVTVTDADGDTATQQVAYDVHPTPPDGHVVLIGHDYREPTEELVRLLANAVLLTDAPFTAQVGLFTKYAEEDTVTKLTGALEQGVQLYGRDVAPTEVEADSLDLDPFDVFLVAAQGLAPEGAIDELARAWAGELRHFVDRGGVIVVTDTASGGEAVDTWRILEAAGLLAPSGDESADEASLKLGDPDPVTRELTSYKAPIGSTRYQGIAPGHAVVTDTEGGAVVVHRPFAPPGQVVLLGHDFTAANDDTALQVANAVFLAEHPGTVAVGELTAHADPSQVEVVRKILAEQPRGVVLTEFTSLDPSTLRSFLIDREGGGLNQDVFLIYEQQFDQIVPNDLGAAWGPVLEDYLELGGVVIALTAGQRERPTWEILRGAGLLDPIPGGETPDGVVLNDRLPFEPLNRDLLREFAAPDQTEGWTLFDGYDATLLPNDGTVAADRARRPHCRLLESFEQVVPELEPRVGGWPDAPWGSPVGDESPSQVASFDGAFGLASSDWVYETRVPVYGTQVLSARLYSGEGATVFLGAGASEAGTVAAYVDFATKGTIGLVETNYDALESLTDPAPFTPSVSAWYRLDVFLVDRSGQGDVIRAELYHDSGEPVTDGQGNPVFVEAVADPGAFDGGVAMRVDPGAGLDDVLICR